ncbi:hypothetical protein B0H19DRAFT_1068243 [Mycena capillaripes]|nr:hypothetical protein B0H19DRAFT_1068243 [Mycena capillaripes]
MVTLGVSEDESEGNGARDIFTNESTLRSDISAQDDFDAEFYVPSSTRARAIRRGKVVHKGNRKKSAALDFSTGTLLSAEGNTMESQLLQAQNTAMHEGASGTAEEAPAPERSFGAQEFTCLGPERGTLREMGVKTGKLCRGTQPEPRSST